MQALGLESAVVDGDGAQTVLSQEHALRRIMGRRRRLDAELRAAVALRYEEEVGERTADVNPQPVRHLVVLSVRRS